MRSLLTSLALCSLTLASAQTAMDHSHGVDIPGLKKEMFAGITVDDLLKLGTEPKTVKVVLVATFNGANAGMNFNGYSHGRAVLTVPLDWKVNVTFINPSPIPHSAIVCDKADTKKLQVPEPYFEGGASPKHIQGMSMGTADFSFVANEAGEYALACGFPAHAATGHWVGLNVSADAKVPTLQLGELAPKEIK
jgi:Sulfocyanin (SoxE) domain